MAFQSTLPAWGATRRLQIYQSPLRFQSTLPAWGATARDFKSPRDLVVISIHAPRMGSDNNGDYEPCVHAHFNPRSPHGERLFHDVR